MMRIALVVGSARAASIHRRLALLTIESAPPGIDFYLIDRLDRLPLYNEDIDTAATTPVAIAALRRRLAAADAVALFAPANNATLSAVLKNVLDWASRPYGRSSVRDKPIAVVSAAHVTETVEKHAHLVVRIAGGLPVEPSALFTLKDLDLEEPAVAAALQRTLSALRRTAQDGTAA